ncbi:hypothetical protein JOD24_002320 [Kroppenstedtia sanguinis]
MLLKSKWNMDGMLHRFRDGLFFGLHKFLDDAGDRTDDCFWKGESYGICFWHPSPDLRSLGEYPD